MSLHRRQLLLVAAASPLLGLAGCDSAVETPCVSGPSSGGATDRNAEPPAFEGPIEAYAWGLGGVAVLGDALRKAQAVDLDRGRLRTSLEARLQGAAPAAAVPDLIRDDYTAGATVQVEGWIISETEAQLAVLHLLVADPDPAALVAEPPTFDDAEICDFLSLDRWGPQGTPVGEGFNVQSDGHYGNWFVFDDPVPAGLRIYLGDTPLRTTLQDTVASTAIFDPLGAELIAAPGQHTFWAYDVARHRKQKLGTFTVEGQPLTVLLEDGARARALCPVVAWGPESTSAGVMFNPQPDGLGAFWFRTACSPPELRVYLGETELRVTRQPSKGLITAKLLDPDVISAPGALPIRFVDPANGEALEVGRFVVDGASAVGE